MKNIMRSITALAVVGFATAAMFFMVMASTQTDAARPFGGGHIHLALPPGMNPIDLPE
jgi:hypothetical protein